MTDSLPHLDDDQLSAILDGESASDPHVDACATCGARFASLQRAAALVGQAPPRLAAGTVDEIVARAVAITDDRAAPIVDLASARQRRRGVSPRWIAAVAAVALVVIAVPIALRASSSSRGTSAALKNTASSGSDAGSSSGAVANEAGGTTKADAPSTQAATGAPAPASDSSFAAARATAAPASTESDLGDRSDIDDLVRTLEAQMSSTSGPTDESGACPASARDVGGARLGALGYRARLRWRGEDSEVLVFKLTKPEQGLTRQAYVMSTGACAVLAEPRF